MTERPQRRRPAPGPNRNQGKKTNSGHAHSHDCDHDDDDDDEEDDDGIDWDTPLEPIRNEVEKVGRNDPCPCGSGKKYKKCHLG